MGILSPNRLHVTINIHERGVYGEGSSENALWQKGEGIGEMGIVERRKEEKGIPKLRTRKRTLPVSGT